MHNEITSLLLDAALLLGVGMSVVFIFLSILIAVIHGIRMLDNALPNTEVAAVAATKRKPAATDVSPAIVAAVTSAIHQYRKDKSNN